MGFIRGSLIFLLGFLLFLAIFATGILLTLSSSLKYENVQPQLLSISKNLTENLISRNAFEISFDKEKEVMEEYCQENNNYNFSYDGYNFVFSCSILDQSSEEIVDYGVNYIIKEIYYKDYDCKFWDCFEKNPMFLISEKAYEYWKGKFYLALMLSIILIFLIFFLIEKKSNLLILIGILMIIPAILLMKLGNLSISLFKIFLTFPIFSFSDILKVFFSQSHTISMKMLSMGISFLIFGVILRVFGIGMKIMDFFEKIKKRKNSEKSKEQKNLL